MSRPLDSSQRSAAQPVSSHALSAEAEASVRHLIASGNDKTALKRAKAIHEARGTAASEALLVEAYAARIQSLVRQNLAAEAQGLLDLVRRRYPTAGTRLDELATCVQARTGSLDDLVAPLNDPDLGAQRRQVIERAIQQEVYDPAALAGCEALAPDHPLRTAASALSRALIAATSGPVVEEALALPEVSHRSPLAPWTLLVRAIACFHRGDDESCLRCLEAIKPGSAPARLVPVIQAALGREPAPPLAGAARDLVAWITGDPAALRRALEALDRAFAADDDIQRSARILAAIRAAVQECRRSSPEHLERLKQHISVRCAIDELNKDQVTAALGGPSRHDAYFMRLFARSTEEQGNIDSPPVACSLWAQFRELAVQEGWFAANGVEVATLYLHMAKLIQRVPRDLLRTLQQPKRSQHFSSEDLYFLFPEKLYQRACALDPHTEGFEQWMAWAVHDGPWHRESIAQAWHKACPRDLQPVLHLMAVAEQRNAFSNALAYLAMAERIDAVHPAVRGARLRLHAREALRHIQQKKVWLADEDLVRMAALPQAQHGSGPAILAALHCLLSASAGRDGEAERFRADLEALMGGRAAAAILLDCLARAARQGALPVCVPVDRLAGGDRADLPAAVARITALAADLQITLNISRQWIAEAAKQFAKSGQSLDAGQLFNLADAALGAKHLELAYAVSAVGLARGGDTEARFLWLRARSVPEPLVERRAVVAMAAADLGRRRGDQDVVKQAVGLVRSSAEFANLSLSPEQADEVLRREKTVKGSSGGRRGPSYRDLVARQECQCADCRRARGEIVDPFDDDDLSEEELFDALEIPSDMPPEVARALFEETRAAVERGESFDQFVSRLMDGGHRRKQKKGRRR